MQKNFSVAAKLTSTVLFLSFSTFLYAAANDGITIGLSSSCSNSLSVSSKGPSGRPINFCYVTVAYPAFDSVDLSGIHITFDGQDLPVTNFNDQGISWIYSPQNPPRPYYLPGYDTISFYYSAVSSAKPGQHHITIQATSSDGVSAMVPYTLNMVSP